MPPACPCAHVPCAGAQELGDVLFQHLGLAVPPVPGAMTAKGAISTKAEVGRGEGGGGVPG